MNPVERFWRNVGAVESGCWEWRAARNARGYGRFQMPGATTAHRASWIINRGPIPTGLVVMHLCDNPPCVRPSHLRLGTMADNQADMARKGRAASGDRNGARKYPERLRGKPGVRNFGEANGQARLTAEVVAEMRASGLGPTDAARRYGITKGTASRILNRQRWAHV